MKQMETHNGGTVIVTLCKLKSLPSIYEVLDVYLNEIVMRKACKLES